MVFEASMGVRWGKYGGLSQSVETLYQGQAFRSLAVHCLSDLIKKARSFEDVLQSFWCHQIRVVTRKKHRPQSLWRPVPIVSLRFRVNTLRLFEGALRMVCLSCFG